VTVDRVSRSRPLDGIRILALEHLVALPFGTQLLADLGAEVIDVEPTWYRDDPGTRWRLRTGRHKRRIVVDFKHPRGQELIQGLAQRVDAFVENYRPGVADSYNLGYRTLHEINPRLVYLSVSGFGHDDFLPSPFRDLPAYGTIGEAIGGVTTEIYGGVMPDNLTTMALGDITTSLFAMVGLLSALRDRHTTGQGQYVDVCMADSLLALNERPLLEHTGYGSGGPTREGFYFAGTFSAGAGHVMLVILQQQHWDLLRTFLDDPAWMNEPTLVAFDRPEIRRRAVDELLIPALEDWASDLTHVQASELLQRAGLAASPVLTPADILRSPHFAARQMLQTVVDERGVEMTLAGNPIKLSKDGHQATDASHGKPRIARPGEHTREILRAELGLTLDELDGLEAEKVIATST
jgi:CoA:oxalate CoA-transferase